MWLQEYQAILSLKDCWIGGIHLTSLVMKENLGEGLEYEEIKESIWWITCLALGEIPSIW